VPLHHLGQGAVAGQRTVRACMLRQQPRRPQFKRIAQILGLATGQIDQPSPASTVIEGSRPQAAERAPTGHPQRSAPSMARTVFAMASAPIA
jgi:hypothetical protein